MIDYYGNSLEEVMYCQEESFNSGAWSFVEPRLETAVRHSDWYKNGKVNSFFIVLGIGMAKQIRSNAHTRRTHECPFW